MNPTLTHLAYLISAVFFILALRGLSSANTAHSGNRYGIMGMTIAIVVTLLQPGFAHMIPIAVIIALGGGIGAYIARTIPMTALPQLVAGFHSLVGLAAVFVALAALYSPEAFGIGMPGAINLSSRIEMSLGVAIGAITFSGSIIAFAKLQGLMSGNPLVFPMQHLLNGILGILSMTLIALFALSGSDGLFWMITLISFALGFLLILPIGGADMPVIISMLNSYSGWAAAGIGFTLHNPLLIITGALVGSSGAILSYIMCKGMNRSIVNVMLGGFGGDTTAAGAGGLTGAQDKTAKAASPEDAAYILSQARSVIIVPGYGMAVAQAQHALREMGDHLKKHDIAVRYAIHPVAGRMPGHMNVLLAEANVPYDDVLELEEINRDFATTDVTLVIGANDVTNPAAKTDPTSPIYGMPVLDVEKSKTVLFIKRSMAPGYAGVENELFFRDNTLMLFGDAKKVVEHIIKSFDEAA